MLDSLDGTRRGRCWTPTPGPRTARSPWAGWASATTAATWPTAAPRPAPTGPPGTCWRSPPARLLPDELRWTKFSAGLLDQGRQGLLLQPLRGAEEGRRVPGAELQQQVYYHRLGTPQSADVLVYFRPEHPEWQYDGRGHRGRPLPGHHHAPGHRRPLPHHGQGPAPSRTRCRSS